MIQGDLQWQQEYFSKEERRADRRRSSKNGQGSSCYQGGGFREGELCSNEVKTSSQKDD